eukprot:CAMPEP_0177632848 /NCGR_PEP_ID=MMETSP0447-20121125/2523_1 /TAXON_ID=0 /ORGANISM="Stygamoeba regulata, Strain BSH-02190019" /LENGTH=683 /DNA_ID=CAMNT_0019134469 /DNA_START=173 /DNA_END=2224 /DNA_ORIENTATION=+
MACLPNSPLADALLGLLKVESEDAFLSGCTVLLSTLSLHATPEHFLKVLQNDVEVDLHKPRVLQMLRLWIDHSNRSDLRKRRDFVKVLDAVEVMLSEHTNYFKLSFIRNFLPRRGGPSDKLIAGAQNTRMHAQTRENPLVTASFLHRADCNEAKVAYALFMFQWRQFSSVTFSEFLDNAWMKKDCDVLAPNLTNLAKSSTKISHWVVATVLAATKQDMKGGEAAYRFFVEICKRLNDNCAYNTMAAILLGLRMHPLDRLSCLTKQLRKTTRQAVARLEKVVDPAHNFKEYRSRLPVDAREKFVFPYLAVHLRDLFCMNDLQPTFIQPGVVNFDKCSQCFSAIKRIMMFCIEYDLESKDLFSSAADLEMLISHVEGLPLFGEDQLYRLSFSITPSLSHTMDTSDFEDIFDESSSIAIESGVESGIESGEWEMRGWRSWTEAEFAEWLVEINCENALTHSEALQMHKSSPWQSEMDDARRRAKRWIKVLDDNNWEDVRMYTRMPIIAWKISNVVSWFELCGVTNAYDICARGGLTGVHLLAWGVQDWRQLLSLSGFSEINTARKLFNDLIEIQNRNANPTSNPQMKLSISTGAFDTPKHRSSESSLARHSESLTNVARGDAKSSTDLSASQPSSSSLSSSMRGLMRKKRAESVGGGSSSSVVSKVANKAKRKSSSKPSSRSISHS